MKLSFTGFVCCLCIALSHLNATIPATPIPIEISQKDNSLFYTISGKPFTLTELLQHLTLERSKFGDHIAFEILVNESIPFSAMLELSRRIKESGFLSEARFYLIMPRIEGRDARGDVIINSKARHEVILSPLPNPPPSMPLGVITPSFSFEE